MGGGGESFGFPEAAKGSSAGGRRRRVVLILPGVRAKLFNAMSQIGGSS